MYQRLLCCCVPMSFLRTSASKAIEVLCLNFLVLIAVTFISFGQLFLGCFSHDVIMDLHTASDRVQRSARRQRMSDAEDCRVVNTVRQRLMDNRLAHEYKTLEANICHQYIDSMDDGIRYVP